MANIIFIYILTIIVSYLMDAGIGLFIVRDLADYGYKFDLEKRKNTMAEINPNGKQISKIERLIPIYNLFKSFLIVNEYAQNKDFILDQIRVMDIIEEMSEYEKKEYYKNPTALNAIVGLAKYNNLLNEAIKIEQKDAGNKIWFILDENKEIQILKVEGPIANDSIESQKFLVIDSMNKLCEKYERKIEIQEKTRNERIQELRNLRSEYTNDNNQINNEKGNQKTKNK